MPVAVLSIVFNNHVFRHYSCTNLVEPVQIHGDISPEDDSKHIRHSSLESNSSTLGGGGSYWKLSSWLSLVWEDMG